MKKVITYLLIISITWFCLRVFIHNHPGNALDYIASQSIVPEQPNTTALHADLKWYEALYKVEWISNFNQKSFLELFIPSFLQTLALLGSTLCWMILMILFTTGITHYYPKTRKAIFNVYLILGGLPTLILAPALLFISMRFMLMFQIKSNIQDLLLPSFILGVSGSTYWIRLSILKMRNPHTMQRLSVSRSLGFSEANIFIRDFWSPELFVQKKVISTQISHMLNGSILVEILYDRVGIGKLLYDSLLRRDTPILELTATTIFILIFTIQFLTNQKRVSS